MFSKDELYLLLQILMQLKERNWYPLRQTEPIGNYLDLMDRIKKHIQETYAPKPMITVKFKPADMWVGFYWDSENKRLYCCPVPMLAICIQF